MEQEKEESPATTIGHVRTLDELYEMTQYGKIYCVTKIYPVTGKYVGFRIHRKGQKLFMHTKEIKVFHAQDLPVMVIELYDFIYRINGDNFYSVLKTSNTIFNATDSKIKKPETPDDHE